MPHLDTEVWIVASAERSEGNPAARQSPAANETTIAFRYRADHRSNPADTVGNSSRYFCDATFRRNEASKFARLEGRIVKMGNGSRSPRKAGLAFVLSAALLVVGATQVAAAPTPVNPWTNAAHSPDRRAALVLAKMTLAEKIDLVTGDQGDAPSAFFNAGIPRLGIPELRMADAGGGIADRGWTLPGTGATATAFPDGAALGATWDPGVARQYGAAVAVEARATGHEMLLGPGSDIVRQPFWGRAGEGPGEDPTLTASLTTPYVQAVQENHVIANLKHYAAYGQEVDRGAGQNSIIDERTIHEVYTKTYAEAIRQADLGSVMCSFNKINSVFACENDYLLQQVLRDELGFKGFVITDFGAIHSTAPSIQAGTDMETGTAAFYGDELLGAVQSGDVPESLVDRSVLRILRTMFAIGIFDNDYTPTAIPVQENGALAGAIQDQAITLLQNQGSVLPLSADVGSVAVIGADANVTSRMGGSFAVRPTYEVSFLDGIRARAAQIGATVNYAPGNDPVNGASMIEAPDLTAIPSTVLSPEDGSGTGLTARHYEDTAFGGVPETRVEGQVVYDTGFVGGSPAFASLYASQVAPVPVVGGNPTTANQSVTYTGFLTPPATGDYRLGVSGWGDARVYLNDQLVVDMTGVAGLRAVDATVPLIGGERVSLRVEYAATRPLNSLQPGTLVLQWAPPASAISPAIQEAVAAAAGSDIAVVYVRTYESEERDRVSLKLPQSAELLINAVAAANPRTVVVLATGGAVTMPWLGSVAGVLENYYGGQEEGHSIARVLFGDTNPSGHLPFTIPRSEQELPPGVANPWANAGNPDVPYTEGVNVGYRGYLQAGVQPLFPFGFGLSYTSFDYSRLRITNPFPRGRHDVMANDPAVQDDAAVLQDDAAVQEDELQRGDEGARNRTKGAVVRVRVKNTGERTGSEVVQVYLGNLPGVPDPVKKLAAYAKVNLDPGERSQVRLTIPRDAFSYWDATTHAWVTPRGTVNVYVGSSSSDIRLAGTIRVR
ncbi:MAG: glycoside hydrolase family 3 protein [Rhodoglobus sp.]